MKSFPNSSKKLRLTQLLGMAAATSFATQSMATVISTFDTDSEGWIVAGDATTSVPTYVASGGNPGGFIRANDRAAGGTWYWQAPGSFLGDQSAAWLGSLSFELIQSNTSSPFENSDVILAGGGITIIFNTPTNPGTDWTSYTVDLTETAGWQLNNLNGAAATASDIQTVLNDLTLLQIRGEFRSGSDTGSLDNVILTPEPASACLVLASLIGLTNRRRKH